MSPSSTPACCRCVVVGDVMLFCLDVVDILVIPCTCALLVLIFLFSFYKYFIFLVLSPSLQSHKSSKSNLISSKKAGEMEISVK